LLPVRRGHDRAPHPRQLRLGCARRLYQRHCQCQCRYHRDHLPARNTLPRNFPSWPLRPPSVYTWLVEAHLGSRGRSPSRFSKNGPNSCQW
jgi:hypothetical protein